MHVIHQACLNTHRAKRWMQNEEMKKLDGLSRQHSQSSIYILLFVILDAHIVIYARQWFAWKNVWFSGVNLSWGLILQQHPEFHSSYSSSTYASSMINKKLGATLFILITGGHNMTKMCSAYEHFISFLKSNFGPLQGLKWESWLSCQDSRISGNLLRIMLRHHHGILLTHHDESCNDLSPCFSVIFCPCPSDYSPRCNFLFLNTPFRSILVAWWLIGLFIWWTTA